MATTYMSGFPLRSAVYRAWAMILRLKPVFEPLASRVISKASEMAQGRARVGRASRAAAQVGARQKAAPG